MIDYVVGDQVVCINDDSPTPLKIKKGEVYTVTEILADAPFASGLVVQLAEFPKTGMSTTYWSAERFRKVRPILSGMEVFHNLLKTGPKILEDA